MQPRQCCHGDRTRSSRAPWANTTFDAATAVIAMDTALEYCADNTPSIRLIARPIRYSPPLRLVLHATFDNRLINPVFLLRDLPMFFASRKLSHFGDVTNCKLLHFRKYPG